MTTAIVRILVCIAALLALYAGAVLLYAVIQQDRAEQVVSGEALYLPDADDARGAASGYWLASAQGWRLAGFQGRAAEAEARAALALPMLDSEQRDATVAAVKRALSLRPTLADLWQALAELDALAPVNLDGMLAALRMAQLTAPREGPLVLNRVRFVLRNWAVIGTGSAELKDAVQDMLVRDITVIAPTYMDHNARILRSDMAELPEDDRRALRDFLVTRLGERRTNFILPPPPPPPPPPAPEPSIYSPPGATPPARSPPR